MWFCDWCNKSECPHGSNCLYDKIVYQAEIITEDSNPSNFY